MRYRLITEQIDAIMRLDTIEDIQRDALVTVIFLETSVEADIQIICIALFQQVHPRRYLGEIELRSDRRTQCLYVHCGGS